MATQAEILEVLKQGQAKYSTDQATKLGKLKAGCTTCGCKDASTCISAALQGLQYQVDQEIYNGTTDTLYAAVLGYLGNDYIPVPPGMKIAYWGFFDNDPSGNLAGLILQFSEEFDAPATLLALDFSSAANGKYLVVKMPVTNPPFTGYTYDINNSGSIPDLAFDIQTIDDYTYIFTRNPYNFNVGGATITFNS